jgi:hypothetical protein
MGVASRISISMDLNTSRKNIAPGPIPPLPPRGGEESFHRREDDGGGVNDLVANDLDIIGKKLSCQDLLPRGSHKAAVRLAAAAAMGNRRSAAMARPTQLCCA